MASFGLAQAPVAPKSAPSPELQGLPLPDQGPMLSAETGVKAGQWALSLALPFGGSSSGGFEDSVGAAGIWHMLTDSIALGCFIGLAISMEEVETGLQMNQGNSNEDSKQQTSSELLLSPALKYYTYQKGPVALYFLGQTHLHFFSDGDVATTTKKDPEAGEVYNPSEDTRLRAQFAFGAEWFPTTSFSLGAHFGLQLDLLRQGNDEFALETFTSGLNAQFYF